MATTAIIDVEFRDQENVAEAAEQLRRQALSEAERYLLRAAMLTHQRAKNLTRPSVILGVSVVGQMDAEGEVFYVASYSGVFGSGRTPDEACLNFDEVWVNGIE